MATKNKQKTVKKKSKAKMQTGVKALISVLSVVLVALVGVILYLIFSSGGKSSKGSSGGTGARNSFIKSTTEKTSETDADTYFQENSEVISVIKADESKDTLSEAEAKKFFSDRGFGDGEITTKYTINGEYKETTISDSSEKHPHYDMFYVNSSNEVWTVSIVNNSIMAYPSSYCLESSLGVEVIVSETKEVMSYDCESNTFYKNIPKENVLLVIQKDKIDSKLLDELTKDEIDKLVK